MLNTQIRGTAIRPQKGPHRGGQVLTNFGKYIGLDVHKETIAVGVADGAGGEPRYLGEIKNRPEAVRRLLAQLGGPDERPAVLLRGWARGTS